MSYIPPHLRVSDGQSKPRPEATSPPSRGPNVHARRSRALVPDVTIIKSAHFISRVIVLSRHYAKFTKYEEETFAHLQQYQVYVLEAETTDVPNASKEIHELSLQEPPAQHIIGTLEADLKGVLEKLKGLSCAENVGRLVPVFWLKFGKLLLHSRSDLLEWRKIFMPEEVEAMCGVERTFSKTFENSVSKENFFLLHELAHKNALQSSSKERYSIQVLDESRPDTHLWCVCTHSEGDEQRSLASKNSARSALTLKKIKLSPIRHMISDVACVGKSSDIRLLFFVKEYLTGLCEEELRDLESCLNKASVDHTAKGGLRWPLGSKQSTSGRFKVVGSVHQKRTVVFSAELRWALQECNRVEFKASSGRISYEVAVRPVLFNEFCKARNKRTTEELMCSIADAIQQVWDECIET